MIFIKSFRGKRIRNHRRKVHLYLQRMPQLVKLVFFDFILIFYEIITS